MGPDKGLGLGWGALRRDVTPKQQFEIFQFQNACPFKILFYPSLCTKTHVLNIGFVQVQQASLEVFSPSPPKLPRTGIGRRGLFGTGSSTYPKYTFQDREEVVKANIRDPLQIIKIVRENETLGFLYMISAVPKSSIEYDTYNLK